MEAISTLTWNTLSVTSRSMPDLLSTPGRCAAALNKTLSNKCIFFPALKWLLWVTIRPQGKKTTKPQGHKLQQTLKSWNPKKKSSTQQLPAGRGDSRGPSTPFIPTGTTIPAHHTVYVHGAPPHEYLFSSDPSWGSCCQSLSVWRLSTSESLWASLQACCRTCLLTS